MEKKINNLVDKFAESVLRQSECLNKGDWKSGNKHAKNYIKSFNEICKIGDIAKEQLKELFQHENDNVRAMAATFLLKYDTDASLEILNEIAKKPGIVGFEAQESIKRWEEGAWDLDP